MTKRLSYKDQMNRVTKKIDKWHSELKNKLNTTFIHDSEYIEAPASPSRFQKSECSDSSQAGSVNLGDSREFKSIEDTKVLGSNLVSPRELSLCKAKSTEK